MFEFNPSDYRNYVYGIVPKNQLAKDKKHVFSLWGENLILFWNGGDVKCFKNACLHYGLPLDQGKLTNVQIHCGFHGWQYDLTDGKLLKAPYAKKTPKCRLKQYKAFVRGGIVFIYTGDEEQFEEAKRFIMQDVMENQAAAWTIYEVPFYLAINSSTDYPHHAFHSFFYTLYGIYRSLFLQKNPLLTTYDPVMLEEVEESFKFKIPENDVEITVYPFCTEYNDIVSSNKWQIFVSPICKNKSRYLINIKAFSRNPLYRILTYLFFHTVIRYIAMPEDQKWLKTSFKSWKEGESFKLCDHDFGLRNYLRKFFIPSRSSRKVKEFLSGQSIEPPG